MKIDCKNIALCATDTKKQEKAAYFGKKKTVLRCKWKMTNDLHDNIQKCCTNTEGNV